MAVNLMPYSLSGDAHVGEQAPLPRPIPSTRFRLTLSPRALAFVWFLSLCLLVGAFLSGLYAGRAQGSAQALAEYGQEAIRLPIVRAVAPAGVEHEQRLAAAITARELVEGRSDTTVARVVESEPTAEYDFSAIKAILPQRKSTAAEKLEVAVGNQASTEVVSQATVSPNSEAATPLVTETLAEGYYVQLAAFPDSKDARHLKDEVAFSGEQVQIQVANVNNVQYFRVLVGPFASREDANRRRNSLRTLDLPAGQPFLKRIDPSPNNSYP